MTPVPDVQLLLHLIVAVFLGGLVGWEREASGKPAGLRTTILICVGSAVFTDLSLSLGSGMGSGITSDPTRIAAQIVAGIGFLGAGTIIQARGAVHGLTTAATLWVVAAIGMGVGTGSYLEATVATLLVLVILLPLGWIERWVDARRRTRRVIVTLRRGAAPASDAAALIADLGVGVLRRHLELSEAELKLELELTGSRSEFDRASEAIMERDDLLSLRSI